MRTIDSTHTLLLCVVCYLVTAATCYADLPHFCKGEREPETRPENVDVSASKAAELKAFACALTVKERKHNNRPKQKEAAAKYAMYAALSSNAYEDHIPIALPNGWRLRSDFVAEGTGSGLALKVFDRSQNGKIVEVVVAFRGTESLDLCDWATNLLPGGVGAHSLALSNFRRVRELYKNESSAKFVVTGHSLGGSLAMHTSFQVPEVEAIVFNASPMVRTWEQRYDNPRFSIWESKEILSIPRHILLTLVPWPKTDKVKFRFQHGPLAIKQHEMYALALNMIKLANADGNAAPDVKALAVNCK